MPSPCPNRRSAARRSPIRRTERRRPTSSKLTPKKGVPQSISLADAIRVGVALSPTFALQNAQWAAIHAKYDVVVSGALPGGQRQRADGQGLQQRHDGIGRQWIGEPTSSEPRSPTRPSVWRRPRRISQATVANESATITITQLIYDGGRTIAAIRSAKEADIAGRATLLRQLQTLALNVANPTTRFSKITRP